ncbi:MAG TPA: hypothetical protein VE782_17150 [Myxococcaceae bacterium]|nr:hypothetical protein [Myxococcaceae bacterium]
MNGEETQGNGHMGADAGVGQRLDQMGAAAQQLVDDAREAIRQIGGALDLRGRVERHPFGMMLAAMGVGYVLGGGLFTPFTAGLVRLGLRLAALPLVKDELIGMAGAAMDGLSGRSGRGPADPQASSYNPQGGAR